MEKVLLMFSGGNDSTLAACNLAFCGYEVNLVTFDNGCEIGIENIRNRAIVLEKFFDRFNYGKIKNLGVFSSIAEFMNLRHMSVNIPYENIVNEYGNLNNNQLNCLSCRSSMYVMSVLIAKELGIKSIADGARKSQGFALEQDILINKYKSFLSRYGIELLLPVYRYEHDSDVYNQLLNVSRELFMRMSSDTVSYEAKCVLGVPMDRKLSEEQINGYGKLFEELLEPIMIESIDSFPTMSIKRQLENPTYSKIDLD